MAIDDRTRPACTLADLAVDDAAQVVGIRPDVVGRLIDLGIRPGVRVTVESDAPFGGPRIVRSGGARLAIARSIARAVEVRREPVAAPGGPSRLPAPVPVR